MKSYFIYFCRLFIFPIIRLFTRDIKGRENIPLKDGFIVASNHIDSLDTLFLSHALDKKLETLRFVGAMESTKILILSGWLYYLSESLIINRKKENREIIIEKIIDNLKNKKNIVIFPEANTNKKKKLLRGRTGVAEIALKTGFPVIPIGMRKTKNSFQRIIEIDQAIYFPEEQRLLNQIGENKEKYYMIIREVTDKIMEQISQLSQKPYCYDN